MSNTADINHIVKLSLQIFLIDIILIASDDSKASGGYVKAYPTYASQCCNKILYGRLISG